MTERVGTGGAAALAATMDALGARARQAARLLARADPARKDGALRAAAALLRQRREEILAANRKDLEAARQRGLAGAMLDRLMLDESRIEAMAQGVEQIAALPDPVGHSIVK